MATGILSSARGTFRILSNSGVLINHEAGPSCMRIAFSTTANSQAAQKKKAPPPKKKASSVRKTPTKGGDGAANKRKGGRSSGGSGSTSASALGLSRDSPYLQQAANMNQLQEFLPESITQGNLYNVVAWSQRTWNAVQFQQFGLPKTLAKQFALEPRPRTLIRPQTLTLLDMLDQAVSTSPSSSPSNSSNLLMHAPTGYGVSTLMLQAFSYALESSWLVIYLPRSLTFVDSSSPYTYSEKHQTYLQPELVKYILQRILSVNQGHLNNLTLEDGPFTLDGQGGKIEKGTKLSAIIQQGLQKDASPESTQTIFEFVMRTIVQQRQVPVLFAIDGVQGLFSKSLYRDPDYRQLESYELAVPRTLQACLRTRGSGSFGGVQLGKTLSSMSLSNTKWPIPNEVKASLPELNAALKPYEKTNEDLLSIVNDCQFNVWNLSDSLLTRKEAGALIDVARREGGLWSSSNDESLMSKLVESGGNVATFQRSLYGSIL